MKRFFKTKIGVTSVTVFAVMMAIVFHRVSARRTAQLAPTQTSSKTAASPAATTADDSRLSAAPPSSVDAGAVAENAAYLDQYYALDHRAREDRDRQGNTVTRRENASTPRDAGRVTTEEEPAVPAPAIAPSRASLRLQGRPTALAAAATTAPTTPLTLAVGLLQNKLEQIAHSPTHNTTSDKPAFPPTASASRAKPKRFNPYGRVIKCELVFAIDSVNEETPIVGLVMEPVYNNGVLIIPAGAELHGLIRADRLRDRLFSGPEWVLVFPRERDKPNGRQLNVRGIVLDRVEPDANGMTWGITDGSSGLEGQIIRTSNNEEIKRFAATFLAAATAALQEREVSHEGHDTVRNTPKNAVLQGVSANLQQFAADITAEIEKHGVFIRVPAGHQFYFYPMQIIDPDAADISADVATVK